MPRFDDYTGEHLIPPYRILDLTDRRAAFCGRLLADYGADVVKVEPPIGDPSRRLGPYPGDIPDAGRSLDFMFYNTNKCLRNPGPGSRTRPRPVPPPGRRRRCHH